MEEKTLTYEEIVKDIERSTGMPSYWKKIVLDLIHRLQEDNKNYDRANSELMCTIAEQKAEIERLTEELDKEYALRLKHQFACEKKDLELKQLEFENAELQKQVDELKVENERLKGERKLCHNCGKYFLSVWKSCPSCGTKPNDVQQAVKDTAEKFAEKITTSIRKQLTTATMVEKEVICFCLDEIDEICKEITENK